MFTSSIGLILKICSSRYISIACFKITASGGAILGLSFVANGDEFDRTLSGSGICNDDDNKNCKLFPI